MILGDVLLFSPIGLLWATAITQTVIIVNYAYAEVANNSKYLSISISLEAKPYSWEQSKKSHPNNQSR